jgi:hypothetical protein
MGAAPPLARVDVLTGRALVSALAEAFAALSDDEQAAFFVEVAAVAATWEGGFSGSAWQWWRVGRHLRTCPCATEEARELVRAIVRALDEPGEVLGP